MKVSLRYGVEVSRLARSLALIFLAVVFSVLVSAEAKSDKAIKALVDKTKVATGEFFTYRIVVEGIFSQPKLTPPKFENFKVVSQSESRSYSFSKAGTKLNLQLAYILFASEPGSFIIEPATIKDKGKEYESGSIKIVVRGKPLEDKKKILPYIEGATDI